MYHSIFSVVKTREQEEKEACHEKKLEREKKFLHKSSGLFAHYFQQEKETTSHIINTIEGSASKVFRLCLIGVL